MKLKKLTIRLIIISFLSIPLSQCYDDAKTVYPADYFATLSSSAPGLDDAAYMQSWIAYPSDGEANVPVDIPSVTIVFTKTIDNLSGSITLTPAVGYTQTVVYSSNIARIDISGGTLTGGGTLYTVSISGVTAAGGTIALDQNYSWTFTTQ